MKISLITVCYNSEASIEKTIESVVAQTYPNIEYIVIDGNSKDATLSIIEKNKAHITKWISEPDKGIYDALNKGIALGTGDVIGFLHSDDFLASTTIIAQIANEFQKSAIDGVYGDLQYVSHSNTNKVIRYWKSQSFQSKLLKKGWMPAHPTLFLKKEIYDKHGVFNTSYTIAADYDFMLRVLKDASLTFAYLPAVVTKMRMGGASNRSLKNMIQKTKEDYRAVTTNKVGGLLTILYKNTSKIKQFF